MPSGKTHFIAGALVGATVNFAIQSAEMAMDYDTKFDWGEFFLCTGAGAFTAMAPDIGPRLCRRTSRRNVERRDGAKSATAGRSEPSATAPRHSRTGDQSKPSPILPQR